ncbi:MAG: hypothetical protein BWY59_01264 [Verrucomicrobia bacterium ADurb.Bin345]|nr:MAG: hypothetical protein BWY59_01264 [Verrucomicrobia bacterium ADurb.Bin345]
MKSIRRMIPVFHIAISLLAGTAFAASPKPKVMLLVDEKSLGTIATSEIEALAIGLLIEEGVPVVDQDMVRANIKKDQKLLKMAGDARGAAALGLQYGADVIVIGEAVAKPSARRIAESNLRTYEAVVTLRAVRTDNSETIASVSETASKVGLEDVSGSSQALKAAGQQALTVLIPKMIEAWEGSGGAASRRGQVINMTIGGVDKAWKLKEIREKLRSMDDAIVSVLQKSYTAGVAIFEVESVIPSEELSERMLLDAPAGLKYQVLEVGRGKMELRVVEANEGG